MAYFLFKSFSFACSLNGQNDSLQSSCKFNSKKFAKINTQNGLIGGIVGNDEWGGSSMISNYWLKDQNESVNINVSYGISGNETSNTGATPKTATELKTQSTYEGWDFDTVWAIDPNGVINDGYPYLRALPPTN